MKIIPEILTEVIVQIAIHHNTTSQNVLIAYSRGLEKVVNDVQKLYVQSYNELSKLANKEN